MGATVSARWATGDDDAVVIVVSSLSPHRCRERKGRAGQSGHDDIVITREREGRADQGEVGERSQQWRDDHDRKIVTSSSSLHRCHEREGRAGQGEVCEWSQR